MILFRSNKMGNSDYDGNIEYRDEGVILEKEFQQSQPLSNILAHQIGPIGRLLYALSFLSGPSVSIV
jgi:hypothetical protein